MNLNIEISDDKAAALKAQAAARGLTVERWLEQIAEQHAQPKPTYIAHLQKTNPKEWARQLHARAESHDRTTPLLTDDAVSCESKTGFSRYPGIEVIHPDQVKD